ncbi:recombinase family protein [Microvirga ossetica]
MTSLSGIAKALNDRGIATDRGSQWHPTSVARLLDTLPL